MKSLRVTILCLLYFCLANLVNAQISSLQSSSTIIYSTEENNVVTDTAHVFTIKDIQIFGNRQTKNNIVLRELAFKKGEQYPLSELVSKFAET